jgi:hypothetical protein
MPKWSRGFGGGPLNAEQREKLLENFESAIIKMGARSYEEGLSAVIRAFALGYRSTKKIRTREHFRKALEQLEPLSRTDEKLATLAFKLLPHITRFLIAKFARQVEADLPSLPGGRPPVAPPDKAKAILDFVADLHRRGCSFKDAKVRAKLRFGCSLRTIERLWAKRHEIDDQDPTINDVLAYFQTSDSPSSPQSRISK